MNVKLEALVGEAGLIASARAAAPDEANGPGPEAQGAFDALVAALTLLPEASSAPVPSVWPGIFGPHARDTSPQTLPSTVADIVPDAAMVHGPDIGILTEPETAAVREVETAAVREVETAAVREVETAAVREAETAAVPEVETAAVPKVEAAAVPKVEAAAGPEVEIAVVLRPGTVMDIEPAPWVDVVLAVRSVQVDAPEGVAALPGEDEGPTPRLDLSASADGVAAPPVMVAVTRGLEVTSPKVAWPEGGSPTVESPTVESPTVNSRDVAPTPLRPDAPETPAVDLTPARRVAVTAVSGRPAELPDAVAMKPAVRADVSADAPGADPPRTHGEPARPSPAMVARQVGAPAPVAADVVAPGRLMESAGTRPTPVAVTAAPDTGATRDWIRAAAITAVSAGVSLTPWHTVMADAPVAATPNSLLRPTAGDGQPLASRLVELVRWQAREGGGRVEITLRPEFLGAMTVTVHVDGGVVRASLAAESQATRDFLQAEAGHLKAALEDQGFTLEAFEVGDEQDPREHPRQRPRQQPGPRRSARSASAGTPFGETFDVVM